MCDYQKFINSKLSDLVKHTRCTQFVIAKLVEEKVINDEEEDDLKNNYKKMAERSSLLWTTVKTRSICLSKIEKIFQDDNQNVVAQILGVATRDDGSDGKYNFLTNSTPLTVKVVKPKIPTSHVNDTVYKLDPDIIGLALVINITEFDQPYPSREGAEHDTRYMEDLWKGLGYQVFTHVGRFNRKRFDNTVQEFLGKFRKQPSQMSCVVFIGTHGSDGTLYLSDGAHIDAYDDFIFKFTNEPVLRDQNTEGISKPKIFITQACQVFTENYLNKTDCSGLNDTIVCYPTVPGGSANCDTKIGSWFVYTLTDVFMKEAYRTDFKAMFNEVRRKMLTDIKADVNPEQVPYSREFGLKTLYFNLASGDD